MNETITKDGEKSLYHRKETTTKNDPYARSCINAFNAFPCCCNKAICCASSTRPMSVSTIPAVTCDNSWTYCLVSSGDTNKGRISPNCRAKFTPITYITPSCGDGDCRGSESISPTSWLGRRLLVVSVLAMRVKRCLDKTVTCFAGA